MVFFEYQGSLPETNIAGWKIHHFDGIYQERLGNFMGYVSFGDGISDLCYHRSH